MNIKDPAVHAMAKGLAARRSTTVTDAVRQALRAELERSSADSASQEAEARKAAVLEELHVHWALGAPLLFKGDDFGATDVGAALAS